MGFENDKNKKNKTIEKMLTTDMALNTSSTCLIFQVELE